MRPHRYVVDLQAYMAECETNYWRIKKLMPEYRDEAVYHLPASGEGLLLMAFRLVQRCKYTTMITIEQQGLGAWLAASHFEVRLYHDAKMAEVFAFQKQGRVHSVYPYPNAKMHQQDEKFQQHRFLSECLVNCLKNGLSETEIVVL